MPPWNQINQSDLDLFDGTVFPDFEWASLRNLFCNAAIILYILTNNACMPIVSLIILKENEYTNQNQFNICKAIVPQKYVQNKGLDTVELDRTSISDLWKRYAFLYV